MTLGIFGNGGAGCVAGDDTQGPMHRRLALAGVGETRMESRAGSTSSWLRVSNTTEKAYWRCRPARLIADAKDRYYQSGVPRWEGVGVTLGDVGKARITTFHDLLESTSPCLLHRYRTFVRHC